MKAFEEVEAALTNEGLLEERGSYAGIINATSFGTPRQVIATAYVPRSAQLAFRVEF